MSIKITEIFWCKFWELMTALTKHISLIYIVYSTRLISLVGPMPRVFTVCNYHFAATFFNKEMTNISATA